MLRAFPLRVLLPIRSITCRTLANGLHVETDKLRGARLMPCPDSSTCLAFQEKQLLFQRRTYLVVIEYLHLHEMISRGIEVAQ